MPIVMKDVTVETRIEDHITEEILRRHLADASSEKMIYVITPNEVELLREYSPSLYHHIAKTFGYSNNDEHKDARLAFQVQSVLVNKFSTLDASIIQGKRDVGTVESKVHSYRRLLRLLQVLGITGYTDVSDDLLAQNNLEAILVDVKLKTASLFADLPIWAQEVPLVTKTAKLSAQDVQKFSYIDRLRELCGRENVVGIMVYGSSARATKKHSDYDNFVVLKKGTLKDMYNRVGYDKRTEKDILHTDGKPISMQLIEEDVFPKYIRLCHDPRQHLLHGLVIYGTVQLPDVSAAEGIERGVSHALLRLRTLKTGASNVMGEPEMFASKPNLFEYMTKTPRFILESALNARDGIRYRSKEEIEDALKSRGIHVFAYKNDIEHAQKAILHAAIGGTNLVEEYFKGRRFDTTLVQYKPACLGVA